MGRKWLFLLSFVLLLIEGILWGSWLLFPIVKYNLSPPWSRNTIPDPILGYRLSPFYPGHDSRGYRNEQKISSAEILTIGDSMTYGFAATSVEAWPSQLATITEKTVYNAGVGGYGFCEYKNVLDELEVLKPKIVIIGLFLGNDLSDTYRSVYIDGRCKDLKSKDKVILQAIEREDRIATLPELARKMGQDVERASVSEIKPPSNILANYSSIYRLLRSVKYHLTTIGKAPFREWSDDSFHASSLRPQRLAFDKLSSFRTVFPNPAWDLLGINTKDVRIKEGLRIIQSVIIDVKKKLDNENVDLIVAILHNKPYVYSNLIQENQSDFSSLFFELADMEKTVTFQLIEFFKEKNIVYVDTLSASRSNFIENVPLYHESDDPHPNSNGYKAIAQEISKTFNRD